MRGSSRPINAATRTLLAVRSLLRPSMASKAGAVGVSECLQPPETKPKIIIVTGPTAVGKTKVGLELARRLGGEVISADSVQVYNGLDVGSDKVMKRFGGCINGAMAAIEGLTAVQPWDGPAPQGSAALCALPFLPPYPHSTPPWLCHGYPSAPL
jgi:hypothetical protein